MAKILSGKETAAHLSEKYAAGCRELKSAGILPTLGIIRIGEDPGDAAYERAARKRCDSVGIECRTKVFSADVPEEDVCLQLQDWNEDDSVHGVLLLRPLPGHMDAEKVENMLLPRKDVDGMTLASSCGVYLGRGNGFAPCTARACLEILDDYGIRISGRNAVIVGRSPVIGRPVSMMLLSRNATVTICHTKTADLAECTRRADILIAAAGCAGMIGPDQVREGQVVIDVGINLNEQGKICGDVDFDAVSKIVEAITPVPGGVGSVTTAVLAGHVIEAAEAFRVK